MIYWIGNDINMQHEIYLQHEFKGYFDLVFTRPVNVGR